MDEGVRGVGEKSEGAAGEGAVWVFHAGALGDFVLVWPLLRALREGGAAVTVVAAGEKGRLAAAELGVRAVDSEERRFTRLWAGDVADADRVRGVARVLSFVADPGTSAGDTWIDAAGRMFPDAAVECIGAPGSASRMRAWDEHEVDRRGAAPARVNAEGPVVVHVGAGSREKWWPMERWAELVARVRDDEGRAGGRGVVVLAGEVEAERMSGAERRVLGAMGGVVCGSLGTFAAALRGARVMIGCDTGPTHLAAQLGVPTVALFGPTDPAVWAPRGPRVRVVAPGDGPRPMAWLSVVDVLRAVDETQ